MGGRKTLEGRRAYYEENREHILEKGRRWYQQNRERRLALCHAWYRENKPRHRALVTAWKDRNPEHSRELARQTYLRNRERVRARTDAWWKAHPEAWATKRARHNARRRGAAGSHSTQEWREKCALFGNCCAYCGEAKPLSRDHDIPIVRGGTDYIDNIIPACRLCNSRKRDMTAAEYLGVMRAR